MVGDLAGALAALDEAKALAIVEERLRAGEDPLSMMEEIRRGMEIVGAQFAEGEYFLSELVYAGELLKRLTEMIKPKLRQTIEGDSRDTVVMATVWGDIHDIGKNIVVALLEANGFKVKDLGVNVPPEKIIEHVRETDAGIVGLSALLTTAIDAMKNTVDAIRQAGLADVKIMIGGAPVDEEARGYTGADAWGRTAQDGVMLAKRWSG